MSRTIPQYPVFVKNPFLGLYNLITTDSEYIRMIYEIASNAQTRVDLITGHETFWDKYAWDISEEARNNRRIIILEDTVENILRAYYGVLNIKKAGKYKYVTWQPSKYTSDELNLLIIKVTNVSGYNRAITESVIWGLWKGVLDNQIHSDFLDPRKAVENTIVRNDTTIAKELQKEIDKYKPNFWETRFDLPSWTGWALGGIALLGIGGYAIGKAKDVKELVS